MDPINNPINTQVQNTPVNAVPNTIPVSNIPVQQPVYIAPAQIIPSVQTTVPTVNAATPVQIPVQTPMQIQQTPTMPLQPLPQGINPQQINPALYNFPQNQQPMYVPGQQIFCNPPVNPESELKEPKRKITIGQILKIVITPLILLGLAAGGYFYMKSFLEKGQVTIDKNENQQSQITPGTNTVKEIEKDTKDNSEEIGSMATSVQEKIVKAPSTTKSQTEISQTPVAETTTTTTTTSSTPTLPDDSGLASIKIKR